MHKMLLDLPNEFETDRLILRPYKDGDEVDFLKMLENGNREYLDELLGPVSQTTDLTEIKIYIRQLSADWVSRTRFVLSYWEKQSSVYLGHIWIEPKDWDLPIFEIGWFIVKNRQGEGLATEATKKGLKILFGNLKAHKVIVTVRNHGSYKEKSFSLSKRCGFKEEGYIRDSVQIFSSKGPGPIVGVYHFGLLRTEAKEAGYLE
ncbi:MAG: GNAT family N-acetyltransferase [Candidatus Hodarchaeota archaeon]